MNIKSLAVATFLGVSTLFGSVSASAAPVSTESVAPFANQNLVLRVGENYNFSGTVFILNNAQNAIAVTLPSTVKGLKPGQATIRVFSNGQYTIYDVFVKTN